MNKEDSLILIQLIASLKEAVKKIENYSLRSDMENLELAKKEALEIKRKIEDVIKTHKIDAVCFIPPTVKREVQFMKELERNLNLQIKTISVVKIKTPVIVPQKTLNKLEDRIENAGKTIVINEKGTYLCTKEILAKMLEGTIINISSTTALVGSTDPIYAGSKAAILGFTKSMAKALAPKIRVNCVAPGVTNSDMTKNMKPERLNQLIEMSLLKRIAEPEDVASAIYFLASDESKHITGTCLDINAGYVLR